MGLEPLPGGGVAAARTGPGLAGTEGMLAGARTEDEEHTGHSRDCGGGSSPPWCWAWENGELEVTVSKNKKKRSGSSSAARTQRQAPETAQGGAPSSSPAPVKHPGVSVSRAKADLAAAGQQEGNPTMLVIALLVSTAFMFAYLHLLVLQQMTQLSGGLAMPDSMMFGYDSGYIVQLAGAMDADALGQLNWVHKTAGIIFPLMFGLSVLVVALWSLPRGTGRTLTIVAGLLFAVVDIGENVAIEAALAAGGEGAGLAATLTVVRWILLIVLTVWMTLMLVGRWRRSVRERQDRPVTA